MGNAESLWIDTSFEYMTCADWLLTLVMMQKLKFMSTTSMHLPHSGSIGLSNHRLE